jgi:hypothetical protein
MATRRSHPSKSERSSRGAKRHHSGNATRRLRPASELRAERAGVDAATARSREQGLAKAIELIEKAQARGEREVSYLTFSDWVVSQLRAAGYRVTFQRALGMGDMDTHRIEW